MEEHQLLFADPLSPNTNDTDVSEDICDAPSDEMYVLPPDGGYGWVVLVASFVCNFLVDGMGYSVGILNETFLQMYGESQAKTALVGSLQTGYGFVGRWLSPKPCPSTVGCSPLLDLSSRPYPPIARCNSPLYLSPKPCPSTAECSLLLDLSPRPCPLTAGCSPPLAL